MLFLFDVYSQLTETAGDQPTNPEYRNVFPMGVSDFVWMKVQPPKDLKQIWRF